MATTGVDSKDGLELKTLVSLWLSYLLKGIFHFLRVLFYRPKKVADYEYHSLFAVKKGGGTSTVVGEKSGAGCVWHFK